MNLMDYLALAFGLFLLVAGASYFVEYAVSLARRLRLKVTVFGAVIVAIGTSLPELVVAVEAAIEHAPDIIVGNILGSNIANVGLILAVALLLGKTLPNHIELNGKNRLLLILSLISMGLLQLKLLFWPVGLALLALAAVLILDMAKTRERPAELPNLNIRDMIIGWTMLIVSLAGVIIGSQLAVNSSLEIAHDWGVPVSVIAATIIAVGTSLPELVVTIMAVKKKEHGLAIGNIVGSNLFNLALIGGVGATITRLNTPISVPLAIFFLLFMALGYLIAAGRIKANRLLGAAMVCLFILYVVLEYVGS